MLTTIDSFKYTSLWLIYPKTLNAINKNIIEYNTIFSHSTLLKNINTLKKVMLNSTIIEIIINKQSRISVFFLFIYLDLTI